MYNINKLINKNIPGLKYIPTLGADDNVEWFNWWTGNIPVEFSECNRNVMRQIISQANPNAILEIGVQRNPLPDSSTGVILSSKTKECVYLGIDIENKSHLDNSENNIHTLQCDSANEEAVKSKMKEIGVSAFDIIHIDGLHTVAQVIKEWSYLPFILSNHGAIIMHDTNKHPGPYCVFDAIDEEFWNKNKYCTSEDDNGIAVISRKEYVR